MAAATLLMMMVINISLFLSLFIFTNAASAAGLKNGIINVANMGAKADGKTDARTAFLKAWTTACNSLQPTTIYVPKKKYLLGEIVFKGPCKNTKGITFKIDGILVAPDYKKMGSSSENWIKFDQVQRVTVLGGFLDGRGTSLWNCKLGKKQGCPAGASSLAFYSSENIAVHNLKSFNAKLYHVVVHSCTNVILEKIMISAPENSPNTDGIHVQNSFSVRILNTGIKTGDDCISIGPGTKNLWIERVACDDCISIGPGTKNLWIERVACGPGHGISIGSLAKESEEEGVENVMVKNVVFTRTQNGLRIKAWARPSNGYVRGVVFKQAVMKNVQNPIVIDQNYCPRNEGCPGQYSGIQISQVTFANIKGTSATQVAMRFDCSKTSPCTGINVEDIKLTHKNMQAQAFCQNARGITRGQVSPPSCL